MPKILIAAAVGRAHERAFKFSDRFPAPDSGDGASAVVASIAEPDERTP